MLTVEPYNEEYPENGNVYKIGFSQCSYASLAIERTDTQVIPKTEYILSIEIGDKQRSVRATDNEMQELVLAYLAVKKEIEEGQA